MHDSREPQRVDRCGQGRKIGCVEGRARYNQGRKVVGDWTGSPAWPRPYCLADSTQPTNDGGWSAGALARTTVARAHRRIVRGGTAISDSSPPEALHVLRKRCKELRYALEMFAPVLDDRQDGKAIKDLKALQDVLGRFQDSEVQRISLRGFAQEMVADGVPANALLAMGELMSHLHAEQQRAHAEFATTFASYIRPATRERMARLVGPSGKAVG